jgi:dTDP-4-amino-4,6-dideoxygalactose transaminase
MKKNQKISFFDYTDLFKKNEKELINIFKNVSQKGSFIMQEELSIFESTIEKYTGIKHAIGVGNATDALQLLFKAGGLSKGDEVIFCSHTMIATASAIAFTGATPVPVEAGKDHLIDVTSIRKAITKNTKAIVPTQLNGRIADMDEITNIADEYDLQIYEDSAQALGAKFKGKSAGSFGLGGCISFYPAKVLGCFGDGGAVLTNNTDVYNKINLMRDHGRNQNGDVNIWGFNSRLDNLQAAILSFFFKNYAETLDRRRSIATHYNSRLKNIKQLVLPPAPELEVDNYDIFQNYEIEAENRDKLRNFLASNGIGTLIQWGGKAVNEFKELGFTQSLPHTENMMRRSLMLPLNMTIIDDEVDYICDIVEKFYGF